MVNLRCLIGKKCKNTKIANECFCTKLQKNKNGNIFICVITFEAIEIKKAPQKDRLNLSFVKDEHTDVKKSPELVVKRPFMS